MNFMEQIVERRIAEGRREGKFDGLSGHGKPIPDLGEQREEGWFARRLVRDERLKFDAESDSASI